MRSTHLSLIVVAAALLTVACSHKEDERPEIPVKLSRSTDTSRYEMQPGDVRIASVDSGVDLALLGDTISGGLSSKTLAKVKHETDTAAVKGSGLGSEIERMVKGTVQNALATRINIPLSAVKDVRYDGKKIVFEWNGRPPKTFGNIKTDKKDVLESFSAEDAQRFVAAVRARKGTQLEK
ncbi:MAG: hypothetical protein JWL61_4818 [Gemmatimonadetes bacterium]|nr:hypothetical protein [Gemmatimonadota bacterium]